MCETSKTITKISNGCADSKDPTGYSAVLIGPMEFLFKQPIIQSNNKLTNQYRHAIWCQNDRRKCVKLLHRQHDWSIAEGSIYAVFRLLSGGFEVFRPTHRWRRLLNAKCHHHCRVGPLRLRVWGPAESASVAWTSSTGSGPESASRCSHACTAWAWILAVPLPTRV